MLKLCVCGVRAGQRWVAVRVRRATKAQDVVDALAARQTKARQMGGGLAGELGEFLFFVGATLQIFFFSSRR
jgi:hypothetical protein